MTPGARPSRTDTGMKADTFAKLVVLEALIDAEIGLYLEQHPASMDVFREGLIARIGDVIDEIDTLDSVAAARVYDAVVDFFAELPEDDAGVVAVTLRFKRAMDRIVDRGMTRRDREQASTWAVTLDELLEELTDEYHRAVRPSGEVLPREYARVQALLARAREVADRMLWTARTARREELREQMDLLTFAVRHQRIKPTEVDQMIRPAQRRARRFRPSTLTRVGTFVLRQLLSRSPEGKESTSPRKARRKRGGGESPATA
jgi:hypothetical protein